MKQIASRTRLLGGAKVGRAAPTGIQPWTKISLQRCKWAGWAGAGFSTLLCVLQSPCKNEKCIIQLNLYQSLWRGCSLALSSCLQNPCWSIRLGLCSGGCCPAARQTQWMCIPIQTGCSPLTVFAVLECRFPLPYLVLEKKGFVLSIRASARNRIFKSLSKKLISFKKRAIQIVIILFFCLTNLLSPAFSAQKWVLTCLREGEFFPFMCCSISSYQGRSLKC